ncbi:hypothetical protein HALLA_06350 [Halostagnicola larsenii XH-48]|uniref:Uncharacterized protein n=1 Tax=Halostagnicola larsenii XH-48 TaxID=797299 RepID=W0JQ81_9EURY|nr:hypothetical protein [Halostagnicola larsenii]AHG00764.1 hypothetical protein HALLA_06350 [Halostagnicola larsenii XH-48]
MIGPLRRIALVATVRHRVEVRRRLRHPQILVALSVGIIVGAIAVVGSLPLGIYEHIWPQPGAYHYGTLAGENGSMVLERARELGAIGVVAVGALTALSSVTSDAWEEPPPDLVTSLSVPEAICGVLGDELLERSWFVAPVLGSGALAFTVGTGTPRAAIGAVVGGLAVGLTGLFLGSSVGLGIRAGLRRFPRLEVVRYVIGLLGLLVLFAVLSLTRQVGSGLAATPFAWYGDVLVATAPGISASPLRVGGALALGTVVSVGSLSVAIVAGRSLWFNETKRNDEATELDEGSIEPTEVGRLGRSLDRFVGRPTAGVAQATWRRMGRSPRAMTYVLLPIGLLWPAVIQLSVVFPELVPVLVVTYVTVAVGLGTTLNPIGNARVALPLILTTVGGRRSVLRGHAFAALVPGFPLVVIVALVTGVLGDYTPIELTGLVLISGFLVTGGIGVSLGVGAWLPNLEGPATTATLMPPELYAMVSYLFAMSLLSAPAMLGFGFGELAGSTAAVTAAVVATGACSGGFGWLGYRYARRSLEAYEADGREG